MAKMNSPRRPEIKAPKSALSGPNGILLAGAMAAVLAFGVYKYMNKSKWNDADRARFEQIMSEMKKPKDSPPPLPVEKNVPEIPKANNNDF
jgi:hypothetical protein